jgi:glucuronoarabinoxylan endo-1,4-beta-xylanase
MGRPRFARLNVKAAVFTVALLAVPLPAIGAVPSLAGVTPASSVTVAAAGTADSSVTVDGGVTYQPINGFGFSEAFQRSNILHGSLGLSPANQQRVLDLLFSRQNGAGFSIVRLGIGSSSDDVYDHMQSIEPVSPGSPSAPPAWVWDGSDNSQVWLAQQAQRYGVHQFYADAWSAPGYMKTNGSDSNGGYLCGVTGETCASGDWRQAYANELAQYIKFYAQSGVRISDVGFLNEPELAPSYAGMLSDGEQAASFIPVLGRTLAADHLPTQIACCDGVGWATGAQEVQAILQDPAAAPYLGLATAHGYAAAPTTPLTTQRRSWESEWAVFDPWDPAWDDGTDASGMTWAQNVMTALTQGNVSAFLYWWGASASTANSGLIRLQGDSYATSGRFWALAAFSRFIRPGAVRISASGSDPGVLSAAFRNRDGSTVVAMINTGTSSQTVQVGLRHLPAGGWATPYLTDATDQVAPQQPVPVVHGQLSVSAPPRSVVTVVLPSHPEPTSR